MEVVQARVADGAHPEAHSLAGWAAIGAGTDVDGGAWLHGEGSKAVGDLRSCGVGRLWGCGAFEDGELKLAIAAELVCRGLKLVLRREEELERACLAGVRLRDVEVEHRT